MELALAAADEEDVNAVKMGTPRSNQGQGQGQNQGQRTGGAKPPRRQGTPGAGNVQVSVRFRPQNELELVQSGQRCILIHSGGHGVTVQGSDAFHMAEFTFDRVFDESHSQEHIYNVSAKPLVDDLLQGYNCTIFAYGQTGSGKTYTMLGEGHGAGGAHESNGVVPRIIADIFAKMEESADTLEYIVSVSYLELHMEKLHDLLADSDSQQALRVRQDLQKGVYVEGLTRCYVGSCEEMEAIMHEGATNRAVASTRMNRESSRSHTDFIVEVEQRDLSTGVKRSGTMHLVDLAGSEMVSKTEATGLRLKEAQMINKSLSALGNVIMALVDEAAHVPYRDSKLTRVLSDALGGNSKTSLIITCSPSSYNMAETLSTLRFGNRAKRIKNTPVVNEEKSIAEYKRIVSEAQRRERELKALVHNLEQRISILESLLVENLDPETAEELLQLQAAAGGTPSTGLSPPRPGPSSSPRVASVDAAASVRVSGASATDSPAHLTTGAAASPDQPDSAGATAGAADASPPPLPLAVPRDGDAQDGGAQSIPDLPQPESPVPHSSSATDTQATGVSSSSLEGRPLSATSAGAAAAAHLLEHDFSMDRLWTGLSEEAAQLRMTNHPAVPFLGAAFPVENHKADEGDDKAEEGTPGGSGQAAPPHQVMVERVRSAFTDLVAGLAAKEDERDALENLVTDKDADLVEQHSRREATEARLETLCQDLRKAQQRVRRTMERLDDVRMDRRHLVFAQKQARLQLEQLNADYELLLSCFHQGAATTDMEPRLAVCIRKLQALFVEQDFSSSGSSYADSDSGDSGDSGDSENVTSRGSGCGSGTEAGGSSGAVGGDNDQTPAARETGGKENEAALAGCWAGDQEAKDANAAANGPLVTPARGATTGQRSRRRRSRSARKAGGTPGVGTLGGARVGEGDEATRTQREIELEADVGALTAKIVALRTTIEEERSTNGQLTAMLSSFGEDHRRRSVSSSGEDSPAEDKSSLLVLEAVRLRAELDKTKEGHQLLWLRLQNAQDSMVRKDAQIADMQQTLSEMQEIHRHAQTEHRARVTQMESELENCRAMMKDLDVDHDATGSDASPTAAAARAAGRRDADGGSLPRAGTKGKGKSKRRLPAQQQGSSVQSRIAAARVVKPIRGKKRVDHLRAEGDGSSPSSTVEFSPTVTERKSSRSSDSVSPTHLTQDMVVVSDASTIPEVTASGSEAGTVGSARRMAENLMTSARRTFSPSSTEADNGHAGSAPAGVVTQQPRLIADEDVPAVSARDSAERLSRDSSADPEMSDLIHQIRAMNAEDEGGAGGQARRGTRPVSGEGASTAAATSGPGVPKFKQMRRPPGSPPAVCSQGSSAQRFRSHQEREDVSTTPPPTSSRSAPVSHRHASGGALRASPNVLPDVSTVATPTQPAARSAPRMIRGQAAPERGGGGGSAGGGRRGHQDEDAADGQSRERRASFSEQVGNFVTRYLTPTRRRPGQD